MSLRITRLHPCREYWFAGVFWSCSVFFVSTHVGRFFWAIRPICCTGISPSLEEGRGFWKATYSLSSPSRVNVCAGRGEVNAEIVLVGMYVWECTWEYACEEGRANHSAPGTSPPLLSLFWSAPSPPPQWFLLQYKSQPALFSLTYTHAHTYAHTEGDWHAHTRIRAQILLQLASAQSRLRGRTSQIVFQMCHLCKGLLPVLLVLLHLPLVHQRDFSAPASAASSSSSTSSTSGNWPICLCSWDDQATSLRQRKKLTQT